MSIFNLKTSEADLESSNAGIGSFDYDQITATRTVQGDAFPNGSQFYRWSVSGTKHWLPSKSYFRVRCKATNGDGSNIALIDGLAPAMNPVPAMYQSCEFRMAGKTVERVSEYLAEVDTLEKRLMKSKAWVDATGNSLALMQPRVEHRQNVVSKDGILRESIQMVNSDELVAAAATSGQIPPFLVQNSDPLRIAFIAGADGAGKIQMLAPAGGGLAPVMSKYFQLSDVVYFNDGTEKRGVVAGFATIAAYNDSLVISGTAIVGVVASPLTTQLRVGKIPLIVRERSEQSAVMELIWQPTMGIFKIGHAMPAGNYELVLNPQTASVYQQRFFESLYMPKSQGTGAGNCKLEIIDIYFYLATVEGPRADNVSYLLDLESTRCQTLNIHSVSGFQQTNFDVSPSTYALSVAWSSQQAGSNTLYIPQKLKASDYELQLNRFFVNYAGQSKPSPDADPQYVPGSFTDYTTQRYMESMVQNGSFFDTGGSESKTEWQDRGPYYYQVWPRDAADRSTRVNVHYAFDTTSRAIPDDTLRIMVFDHYRATAKISVKDGQVVECHVELV